MLITRWSLRWADLERRTERKKTMMNFLFRQKAGQLAYVSRTIGSFGIFNSTFYFNVMTVNKFCTKLVPSQAIKQTFLWIQPIHIYDDNCLKANHLLCDSIELGVVPIETCFPSQFSFTATLKL